MLIGALILWLTGWTWIDTAVAAGIGLWVLPRAWSLLKETVNVLLEGVPEGIELDEVAPPLPPRRVWPASTTCTSGR